MPGSLLMVLGVVFLSGCYTYRPVETPSPGSMLRVRVPVTSALNNPNQAPATASIEGLVLSAGDTISLATETRRQMGAYREIVQYDTLRLAVSQTSSMDVREFSAPRSVVLGVAIAGAAGAAAAVAFGLGGGSVGEPPGPGDPVNSVVISGSLLSAVWGLISR